MSLSTERPPETAPDTAAGDRRRWFALAVVLVAAFMDLLDVTIVNVAAPSLQRDLNASFSAIGWVTAGYALAFAAVLISGGRLGDIYGRKRILLIGMAGFTAASFLCGVAQTPGMLIGARILQGVMAALMIPQVLAIIHVTFPPTERGKVFGLYGAIGGLAVVSGPILGGLFIEGDLFGWGWRPIFLINIPVGIAGFIAAVIFVSESKSAKPLRLDVGGVILATASVLMLVYPLTQGRELGWPAWAFALMAGSVVVLGIFIMYERRVTARGGSPLVVLSLFRTRSFAGGFSVNLLFNLAYGTFFLMWAFYMQIGLGWSALHAGLTGLPFFIGLAISAGMAVQYLTPKFGRKVIFAGGILLTAGALLYIVDSDRYGTDITSWHMIPPLFIMGLGMGYVVAPLVDFALTEVPHDAAGSASGLLSTTQQLGASIGIAVLSVVFLSVLPGQADAGVESVTPAVRQELTAASVPAPVQDQILAGYRACAKDRLEEEDPSAVPASCRFGAPAGVSPEQAAGIQKILTDHAPEAQAETFSRSYRIGMFFVVGMFLLVTLLMFSLPRYARPQEDATVAI